MLKLQKLINQSLFYKEFKKSYIIVYTIEKQSNHYSGVQFKQMIYAKSAFSS